MQRSWAALTAAVLLTPVALVGVVAAPPAQAYTPSVKPVAKTIATSGYDTVLIAGDGQPYGIGYNGFGELTGSGFVTKLTRLTGLPAGVRATAVAEGYGSTVVLGSDGRVYGTGSNDHGQLGPGPISRSTLTPIVGLPAGVKAIEIAALRYTTVILGSDGRIFSIGEMLGTPGSSQASVTPLIGLSAGVRAQHIWGGGWDLVVLASDHQLYGIGANSFQELTVPSATGLTRFTWQPYGLTITAAAVGYTNVALLGSDGRVWITGDNSHGELGTGTTDNGTHPLPEPVPGLHDVVAVAVGSYNLLAADRYGLVWGIGDNSHHQLTGPTAGTGATPQALRVAEAQPTNAATVEVASGGGVSLVRAADGVVLGAGDDNLGAINGGPGDILGLTALGGQRVLAYARPTITGTRKVGRVLTAHAGSWSVRPSKYGYQWYRNATKITGATRTTYKLTKYDRGHRLHVVVTASRSGFGGSSATSAQTGKIA